MKNNRSMVKWIVMTAIGLAATFVTDWVSEKKMEEKIEEKVNEALTQKENEVES